MSYWKKLPHDCEPLQGVTVSGRYIKGWGRNTPFRSGAEPGSRDWTSDWRCQLEQVGVCFLTWRILLRIAPFSASEHTSLWEKAQRPETMLAVGKSRYPVSRNVDGC